VFKGFVGKGKDITTINFAGKSTVAVFEGPYDYLTWLAMRGLVEPDCGVIILHAVSLKARALKAIGDHGFGRVMLYLDRDAAGREATAYFRAELGNRNVVDASDTYRDFKDLNEWWVAIGAKDAASRQPGGSGE
jgi:Toprim-like